MKAVLLFLAALVVAGGVFGAPALSQEGIDRVISTGTRVIGPALDDGQPVTVIDREALEKTRHETLGGFLQELAFMSGSPIGTSVNRRGDGGAFSRGIETVELRGLGAQRTLVLVNGRRMAPGGGGASGLVDLAMIPMGLVERVEVLKAGASVEYGADAVAGVVNIITRDDLDGAELRARGSITGRGDAESGSLGASFGRVFARGRLAAGAEYFDQAAVSMNERAFSRGQLAVFGPGNELVPGGSSAPPGGNFRTSRGRLTLIDGAGGGSPDDFRPYVGDGPGNDRFNFNPYEDLRQDARRVSAFLHGSVNVSPGVDLFTEAVWQQRDSAARLAPLPFFTTRLEGVEIAADNAYNPFGENLTDARRRLVEAGPRRFVQETESWRAVVGIEGSTGGWFWDASLVRARHSIEQFQTGDVLVDRVSLALGPSFIDAAGNALCGTPAEPVDGCVPLNLFGGPGSISEDMLAYVGADLKDTGFNAQTVFNANVSGDLFEFPAGPLAAAFGIEYRDESGADMPDPQTAAGNTSGAVRAATRGGFESRELYAEFGVPLIRDRRLARTLDLDLGARGVKFSNFGAKTVFEAGLRYQPVRDVVIRSAWSQTFRAPNIRELFGGATQSNPAVTDPCADFSGLDPVRIERCIAQGVPADGSFDQTGNETPQLGGGNPDLEPEDAETFTLGVSWRPHALENLAVHLDYYDIQIENGIAALGANTVLDQCLETGAEAFCGRIDRAADGAIIRVRGELQNIALETARGLDLDVAYAHALPRGGLRHRLMLGYVAERDRVAFPDAEPYTGAGGFGADGAGAVPRWKGNYRADWRAGRWELGYGAYWIGALKERGGELYPGTVNRAGNVLYHDLRGGYALENGLRIGLGVDNVTDRDPPFLANGGIANTDVATYRLLGRTWWLTARWRG